MAITFTLNVLGASGLDSRWMFPGSVSAFIYAYDEVEKSISYRLTVDGVEQAPLHTIDFEGANFASSDLGGYFDMRGNISSATLSVGGNLLAQLVVSDPDGIFNARGGVPMTSVNGLTPNTLMNAINFMDATFVINGNSGADKLFGSQYNDIINGRIGSDLMVGGVGDDTYFVDNALDRVIELDGEGTDRIASSVSYVLAAGQSVEIMQTTSTAGTAAINLTGNEFVQSLLGNAGANRLDGGGGADAMRGYGGNDLYYVDNAGDLVFEVAGQGYDTVAASTSYTLRTGQSIEVLQTTNTAGTGAISLAGNEIGQVIKGNNGTNVIYGRGGNDVLYGFGGSDTFVFDTAPGATNRDTIMDFSHAADTIRLDKSVFAALTVGNLAASAFKDIGIAGAVVDSNDRILYNSDTGALFYDADGSGAASAAIQFATLFNHPNDVSHLDFVIVA